MTERELMERIATCDPTLLLMHIEEDTAYDAAILGKVFELAKEQARAALASSDAQADGAKGEAVAYIDGNTLRGFANPQNAHKTIPATLRKAEVAYESDVPLYTTPQAECAPRAIPSVCDGKEQDEFEAWAQKEKFDMSQHPLHWLFLNERTYAARQGWKGALEYVKRAIEQAAKEKA